MIKKNNDNELSWVTLFFKWLSKFTFTLIDDVIARRFIAMGICAFGVCAAVLSIYFCAYKVINLLNLLK